MKKTILVSGAGSGIGQAIAQILSQQSSDHRLILLGRDIKKLESTRKMLLQPEQHVVLPIDLRRPGSLKSAFQEIKLVSQNLFAVIANAGAGGENEYGPADRWNEIIETNLTGTYHLVNEALPALKKSTAPYKHIVVVSSILAHLGVPKYSAYCASKAGLLGLTRSWAAEFSRDRILVNALCPGWVETEMAKQGLNQFAQNTAKSYDEVYREQMAMVPLRKMSQPHEIAGLVSYLISQEQTSITGQALNINNGALMF